MSTPYSFKIYNSTAQLPVQWNDLAVSTIFLSKKYLEVLEKTSPGNMVCHFIGIFENDILVGIALSQFLDLNKLESFGERDKCIKTAVRNFVFRNFGSHVLVIGNNMLTGQNSYALSDTIDKKRALQALNSATTELKKMFKSKGKKIHITTYKDFDKEEINHFAIPEFENDYQFSTQPNMVFAINGNWKSEQDYIDSLSKKYRDQYKRARKKANVIEKRKLHLEDIIALEDTIYNLYIHVAKNAPFNTFFLPKNHFRTFKEIFKDKFLFYGYFINEKLIGFNTLIKNGAVMDTYFLGYNESIQREKMLYLNMLYDMIAYSINKGFKEIVFARTALEIKSSVGAKPVKMYGFIAHSNPIVNSYMPKIFKYLEPETIWQERNPFK
ncbi:peptidogalycan biosysnthesis protein [Flavobacterium gawalongense]|uniref:8-amino-7-oxononanoate synthase n=1 Tax=Flavobacterium gawalongense TaxID=2594432 RepID=A0A553BJ97_9FLAO|nr:peptidogalycan biosysnthesis protein [Flavobacterium gawalongense]TRX08299.1 8-amino-7-oxononanoate synthase [Flavobacterium gawalongense]TRX09021.1 8-amino-7-oxononanoate synthase [Flavobacterium gawalongense]TRX25287.1 8-amino-7-oxononanoate synthase [Flavobacterium gawalongense]